MPNRSLKGVPDPVKKSSSASANSSFSGLESAQRTAVKQRPHQENKRSRVAMSEPVVHHHGRERGPSRSRRGAAVCLQRLYGWTVPLSIIFTRGESGARDMRPPVTNLQRRARDAHQLTFAPSGVPKPVTNTQGKPRYRLPVLPSLGSASHVPPPTVREVKTWGRRRLRCLHRYRLG
jgi:hypothetical protein